MTVEPTRARYSDATRDKLLEAAGRAFAERGYAGATVRDICKEAGANVAAVNYYFKDKLALYTEVLNQMKRAAYVDQMRAALDQKASPEEILRDVIKARLRGLHGQKRAGLALPHRRPRVRPAHAGNGPSDRQGYAADLRSRARSGRQDHRPVP